MKDEFLYLHNIFSLNIVTLPNCHLPYPTPPGVLYLINLIYMDKICVTLTSFKVGYSGGKPNGIYKQTTSIVEN